MKKVESDVAVVAAGPAGLAAAVTAAQGGASVIVFEKAPVTGGVASPENAVGNGFFAVQSKLQRRHLQALTKEEAFEFHMDFTHWRVDARLVRDYYYKSASTIEWMEKLGVEFEDLTCHNPGLNYMMHTVKGPPPDLRDTQNKLQRRGTIIGRVLTERAKEMGAQFFLETPGKKILKEKDVVVGVIAEDKSGEEIQAKAKAVVIATGGFSDNPEMIKTYTGFEWGRNLFSSRMPNLAGDGIKMAWEAGAGASEMIMALYCNLPMGMHPYRLTPNTQAFSQPTNIVVNLSGERFINEELLAANPVYAGNACSIQKSGCGFSIFDEATKKYYEEDGFYWRPDPITGGYDAKLKELKEVWTDYDKHIFVVDSLEELANKAEINLASLRTTVNEYNECCEKGRDDLFNKYHVFLRPLKQPKFYAGRIAPHGFGSQGGIRINHKTEVLDKNHDVIPGLYAAGSDASAIYGDTYTIPMPANMLAFALNSGRMAGENLLEYIKSIGK